MIPGVHIKQLTKVPDERGAVYHMLRRDDPEFKRFGEIYFSLAYPGKTKGWHRHKKMTLNYAVIEGMIKLVLYDGKETMTIYTGEENYQLITIPPMVWNAFKCIGTKRAIVANCATHPYDAKEIENGVLWAL